MVNNETIELINYVKELDAINNIKVFLICIFLLYAVLSYIVDKRYLSVDNRASFKMMSLGAKVFYVPLLIFFSTMVYQLDPSQDLGFLIQYHLLFYIVYGVYAFIVLSVYLIEKYFKEWLGWEITMDGLKVNVSKLEGGNK